MKYDNDSFLIYFFGNVASWRVRELGIEVRRACSRKCSFRRRLVFGERPRPTLSSPASGRAGERP